MSNTDKIWIQMTIWTVVYVAIAFIVQGLSYSRAIFIGVMFFWMGDPPTAVWIIGIIVIVHAYLTNTPYMSQIWREMMVWAIIYIVFAYSLVLLPPAFIGVIYLIGFPPSAIWVIGNLIIVYRKLRFIHDSAVLTEKVGQVVKIEFVRTLLLLLLHV